MTLVRERENTAAGWTASNPVLRKAEIGVETDTGRFKLGDGHTLWTGLSYFDQGEKGDKGDPGDPGVVPVKATGAEINTGTDDAKFATAKAIADSDVAMVDDIPVKAIGTEINTGTDDAKYVTAKAIADSDLIKLSDVTVQVAAAPPEGAPTGAPFAYDSTASTGGLYFWNGAAWVKVATILS